MERGIGEFVVENTPLYSLALESPPDPEISAAVRAAYNIDRHRTVKQDCAFGIGQLVDVALRALSPGINDTTTAVMCLDYLTAILARLAAREIPSSLRNEDGELRVIVIGQTFAITWLSVRFTSFRQLVRSEPSLLYHNDTFADDAMKPATRQSRRGASQDPA